MQTSKNKYAKSKRTRLKPFMHKVDVWFPTLTYNKLRDQALANGLDISQAASNDLYRSLHDGVDRSVSWFIPAVDDCSTHKNVTDVLSKFILATLKTGISQDDLIMNALDSYLEYGEIVRALNYMLESDLIDIDKKGIIKYKYFSPIEKKDSLGNFKGKKVYAKIKDKKPERESLVNKPRRTK